jgi:hypothetical protein
MELIVWISILRDMQTGSEQLVLLVVSAPGPRNESHLLSAVDPGYSLILLLHHLVFSSIFFPQDIEGSSGLE